MGTQCPPPALNFYHNFQICQYVVQYILCDAIKNTDRMGLFGFWLCFARVFDDEEA